MSFNEISLSVFVSVIFEINAAKTYQEIHGFGGAFTDATGINIKELPQHSQENLLEAYFSNTGIQYSLCRVPMGATDFSMEPYTYNDIPDSLEHFRIRNEDILYKARKITRNSPL